MDRVIEWKLIDVDNLPVNKEILVRTKKGDYLCGKFLHDKPIFYILDVVGIIDNLDTIIDYYESGE